MVSAGLFNAHGSRMNGGLSGLAEDRGHAFNFGVSFTSSSNDLCQPRGGSLTAGCRGCFFRLHNASCAWNRAPAANFAQKLTIVDQAWPVHTLPCSKRYSPRVRSVCSTNLEPTAPVNHN